MPRAAPSNGVRGEVCPPGTVVGAYTIVELIGEGGMGHVYLAEHAKLGRKVALKMLRGLYTQNKGVLKRFFTEARAVNQINHEHIVEITDFVEDEEGRSYYIMELLRGQTLGECLAQERVLALPRVLSITVQACEALAAVHEQGFVHRDLKPDNVFLTERWGQRDFVKLLDFGVVKLAEPLTDDSLSQSRPGAILGTPAYMSPEQAGGKHVDSRSDIYSLGILIYQMVTGRRPLEGQSYGDYVYKHLTEVPVRPNKVPELPAKIPAALDALIMRCLEKDPDRRPRSAVELLSEASAIGDDERCKLDQFIPTLHVGRPQPEKKRRVWLWAALGAVAVVVCAALAVVAFWSTGSADGGRASPPSGAQQVTVTIDSTPRGAEVFRPGGEQPLGLTPLPLPLEPSAGAQTFELRLPGYENARRRVSPDGETRVVVALKKQQEQVDDVSRTGKKAPPRRVRREVRRTRRGVQQPAKGLPATLDPFAR